MARIFITGSAGGLGRAAAQTLLSGGHDVTVPASSSTRIPICRRDVPVKVDQAALKSALEVRIPFLDHRIVDLVNSMPLHFKLREGTTKYILRKVLADLVPPEVLHGPKRGFGIPIKHWLRSEMGDFARDMLLSSTSKSSQFLKPAAVQGVLDAHRKGGRDLSDRIWALLVLEEWCQGVAA